jgi:uncharacterized protein (TIGR02145 family)
MKISHLTLLISLFLFSYCNKKTQPTPPVSKIAVVAIDSVTNISLTSADVSAHISFNGGLSITDKGICWSTNQNPTIAGLKDSKGSGDGLIFSKVTGMVKGIVYYVRAYATNSEGTGYSAQQTVKAGTVADIDGNVYDIVTINGVTWMAGNLKVTRYSNGDAIPLVTSGSAWQKLSTGAYAYVNNSATNTGSYGLLYNWFAAFDSRGICPKGYKMVAYNTYNSILNYGYEGGNMKTTGTTFWKAPNTNATNSTGFSAPGTGFRDSLGVYQKFNEITYFWDTDQYLSDNAWVASLEYNYPDFLTNWNNLDKRSGLCVRCLLK